MGPSLADLDPGVHRLSSDVSPSGLTAELERAGWATAVVDVSVAAHKAQVMEAFAGALGFPSWFGRNWDALDDALRDLSWWPAGRMGRAIITRDAHDPTVGTHPDHDMLVDVLETAVARWASTGSPLVVLLLGSLKSH